MLKQGSLLGILIVCAAAGSMQAQTKPQTARQALIEMFSGRAGSLEKHLPEVTLTAVQKADPGSAGSMISAIGLITGQMQSTGRSQSYETGPLLLVTEDPKQNSKLEVVVERDSMKGDADEIELSFRAYKDGNLQTAGMDPRLVFLMKPENNTWRLYDMKFSIGFSFTDPKFLKLLNTPIQPQVTSTASATPMGHMQNGTANLGAMQMGTPSNASYGNMRSSNEASASAAIRSINTAQMTYAASYPAHGFTCTLSDLGGIGGGMGADEHHAMLVEPRISNGRKNGYMFKLSSCNGSPAATYTVVAVPTDANAGSRAFCSDQSGAVRFSADGNADSCLKSGQPLQ
jgi:type IV pilus assembly protein PilA